MLLSLEHCNHCFSFASDGRRAVVSNRNISIGERIMEETPILIAPENVYVGHLDGFVAALTEESRSQFLNLRPLGEARTCTNDVLSRFLRNGVCVDSALSPCLAVCPTVAGINHSCTPNVNRVWNHNLKAVTVHALRNIRAGEELLAAYVDICDSRQRRNEELRRKVGFECHCFRCSDVDSLLSDQRRLTIRNKKDVIFMMCYRRQFACAVEAIGEQAKAAEEEGIADCSMRQRLHEDACEIYKHWGKHDQARSQLLLAKEQATLAEGIDSLLVQKYCRMTIPILKLAKLTDHKCTSSTSHDKWH